jgi:biotin carboxyl carrier protein
VAELKADLTANVWKIEVRVGDEVKAGQAVAILESMKMEIPVESTVDGVIASLHVAEGDVIHEGDVVAVITEA